MALSILFIIALLQYTTGMLFRLRYTGLLAEYNYVVAAVTVFVRVKCSAHLDTV